jgi:hypothetical protein
MRILSRAKARMTKAFGREGSLRIMPAVSPSGGAKEVVRCKRDGRKAAFSTDVKGAEQTTNSNIEIRNQSRKHGRTKTRRMQTKQFSRFSSRAFVLPCFRD